MSNNKKKYQCNNDSNKKGKINLIALFNFMDISKLYLIKKYLFYKYSLIVFFTLAVLFCASLYTIVFKSEVDLSVYYPTGSIIPSLCMVYLMCKNIDNSVELSIKSIYMISNLALLSLILALVICIVANLLLFEFYTLSYYESFFFIQKYYWGFLDFKNNSLCNGKNILS